MALPPSGNPLSISQIRTELSSASGSLRTLSSLAGFSTPDSISEFYGYPQCSSISLDDVQYVSGNMFQVSWTSGTNCSYVTIQWSRDQVTWTNSTFGCTGPQNVTVSDKTGTWYFRAVKNCSTGGTATSNVITHVYGIDVRVWGQLTSFYAGFRLYARYSWDGIVYPEQNVVVSTSPYYLDFFNVQLGSVFEVNICDSTQFYFTKLGVSTLAFPTPTVCSYIFTEVPITFTTTTNIYVQGDPSLICNAG